MFNRREQVALLLLSGALLVGTGLAVTDYYHPSSLEEFQVVPRAVAVPEPVVVPAAADTGRVSLNAATAAQLQRLPGIGPHMAARILEYRREHGEFKELAELQQVRGIGPRTIEKLRPFAVLE